MLDLFEVPQRPGRLALLLGLATLAACGSDGGGSSGATDTAIGTVAYVQTECRDSSEGFYERQALRIRQGDREPVTVFETPGVGPITVIGGLCRVFGLARNGGATPLREAFQNVSVSPDGSLVAFEVSDDFSVSPPLPLDLPPDREGIFIVRADGTALRRLGPSSREPFFAFNPVNQFSVGLNTVVFSPDSRTIAFIDRGPDGAGNEATQLVTIDVQSGRRTQITHLPPGPGWLGFPPGTPTIGGFTYVDDRTIGFLTTANPDGSNTSGDVVGFTIATDGTVLRAAAVPVALPGGTFRPTFIITGDRPAAGDLFPEGAPVNPLPGSNRIVEVFLFDGKFLLQLTNFRRADTDFAALAADRQRVFFIASADPLGTNPTESCQIFSIDRTGGDLRQLTSLHDGAGVSKGGCVFLGRRPGCAITGATQDARTGDLYFYSTCDPFGTNPLGGQVFAMGSDGSDLRQVTDARGLILEPDGTVTSELVGPVAYGPYK